MSTCPRKLGKQQSKPLLSYREEDEEMFQQNMFKVLLGEKKILLLPTYFCQVLCGTKPFSDKYKARKYKVQEQFLTKADFEFMMRNLPVKV